MNGDVIGINTAILGQSGSIGIGFSIPSNSAKKVINQLIEFGETKRGWLGVRIQTVTKEIAEVENLDEPRGALVASVADGSPSEKGGIKSGDIILEFDGKRINEMSELPKIVAETEVGSTVNVKVWRNKREITKKIVLGRLETSEDFKPQLKKEEKPKQTRIEGLKIEVRPISEKDIADRKLPQTTSGVVITKIENDSPVNYLNVNDIIIEAQKRNINTAGDLNNVVNSAMRSSEKTILIVIYNNQNQKRYIGVKLD
jgi:serine protease Do